RLKTRYLDQMTDKLDEALAMIELSLREGKPTSVGLLGNAADIVPEIAARGIAARRIAAGGVSPDLVTDQTSAHDPVNGYLPRGWTLAQWAERRQSDPGAVEKAARASMAEHVRAMLALKKAGAHVFDYGNNIRQMAMEDGVADAFDFPGFVPAYIRPLFCRGIGPFRWAALSCDPEDHFRPDARVQEVLPDDQHLHHCHGMPSSRIPFHGLPSRICLLQR